MRKIMLIVITSLLVFFFGYQLLLINSHHTGFSEPDIISFALTSEFILFVFAGILIRQKYADKETIQNLQLENMNNVSLINEKTNLFNTLFDHSHTGIALLDLDGHIVKVNQAFCSLLAYRRENMIEFNYYKLLQENDFRDLQVHIQELINKQIPVYLSEQQVYKKNGELLWTMSTFALIRDSHEQPVCFVVQLQNISLQKKAEERLQHMAYHDPLTGLANRNKLEQFMNHILAASRRHHTGFAVMFLDLDRFKNINDTIGHDAGDILLQIVAERLHSAVRNTDMVARLGGDEFVLLITDVKKAESVALIAQKILNSFLQAISVQEQEIYITTSIGISLYPHDGINIHTLMKHADLALYRAKEHGRNNYQFYTNEMTSKAQEKLALQNALGHALSKNEFLLHYQPKMNLETRKITGVEAFLRWKNKEYGMVSPDEIISLAEETGLILQVSDWIVKTACQQLKEWHKMGFTSLTMSVNCSPRQFKHVTFVDDIIKTLAQVGIPPQSLEIEITEKMIMDDPENTLRALFALKDLGLQIVIDDFGTGYWSLNNLRRLSIDKIKIDKSFIKQVVTDETSAAITTAILAMANKLNIKAIAEGVETREQYDFLVKEGCAEIQGYYLTQALPEDLMTAFLNHPVPDAESISKIEITT